MIFSPADAILYQLLAPSAGVTYLNSQSDKVASSSFWGIPLELNSIDSRLIVVPPGNGKPTPLVSPIVWIGDNEPSSAS